MPAIFPYLPIARAVAFLAVMLSGGAAMAQQAVSNERDLPNMRLGQKVLVDDGSCPTGQVKEVTGSSLTASGVVRTAKCVPRIKRR